MELIYPHKHIKNTSTSGNILLKTNWKLVEGFLYNQYCKKKKKKDRYVIGYRGKKSDWAGTYVPGRGCRKKGRLHEKTFTLGS